MKEQQRESKHVKTFTDDKLLLMHLIRSVERLQQGSTFCCQNRRKDFSLFNILRNRLIYALYRA